MQEITRALFLTFGIEIEYMIVKKDTLDIAPICDELLRSFSNAVTSEVVMGQVSYSNELALHVVELKTTDPARTLQGLDTAFHEHVQKINSALAPFNACLMPTGMHPWMNPEKEMRLWPHGTDPVYQTYNRIFNCQGHGWANLQSTHLNLPFSNEKEFSLIHNAIRLLLPIIPALSASTPFVDGKIAPSKNYRLEVYKKNQKVIPSIAGSIIPEEIGSYADYNEKILLPMYRDISAYDPEKILQHEWLNSRGAIARFDRSCIEIRIVDVQEAPIADIAIASAIVFAIEQIIEKMPQHSVSQKTLVSIFDNCIKHAEQSIISAPDYLEIFQQSAPLTANALWHHILDKYPFERTVLDHILKYGSLSTRIINKNMKNSYKELINCLQNNRLFI